MTDDEKIVELFTEAKKCFDNKEYEKEIECYNQVIEINPKYSEPYYNRAVIYANLNKYEEATLGFTKYIEINNNNSYAYNARASTYFSLGKYEEAIKDFTKSIEINPNDSETYNIRGNVYANQEKYDEAIADYTKAIQINPNFSDASNNRGLAYYKQGKYEEATTDYTKVIEINPNDREAYNIRGSSYSFLGKQDEAIKDFTKSIEINPNDRETYNNRGTAYSKQGKHDEAIADYTKAIQINAKYSDAYNNRGLTFAKQGNYDKAITDFTRALELNPDDGGAYNNRGLTFFYQGNHDKAIVDYTKAIEINPNFSEAYNNRGLSYFYQKKYKESIESIKELVKNCSYIPYNIYFILANFYEKIEQDKIEEIIKSIINKQCNAIIKNNKKKERKSLFSYVPFDKNTMDSIKREYKYASKIFNFNDPTDPTIRLIKNKIIIKNMKHILNKIRIACFSTNHLNMLMFSHYADRHKGICIEYDFSEFNETDETLLEVDYKDELHIDDKTFQITIFSGEIKKQETSFLDLFNTKHKSWKYEKEYRVITYGIDKIFMPIKAIYCGKEMSKYYIELIKILIADKPDIKLYKLEVSNHNVFELVSTPIEDS